MSTVVLTLNTLPYFMQKADSAGAEKDYPPFALLEAIYMSWFTFEFLVCLTWCLFEPVDHLKHLGRISVGCYLDFSGSVTLSSRDLNPWLPAIILRLFNYWITRCIQALRCHLVCLDTNLLNGKIVCPNQLNTIAEYTSNCNGTKQKLGFSKQHNKDQLINRIASMRYSTSLQ